MITTVYSVIQNGGDGSASMMLYDSETLAEWVEEHDDEPFAESTIQTIEIEHEGSITIKSGFSEIVTPFKHYIDLLFDYGYDKDMIQEFHNNFFPNGLPEFRLEDGDSCSSKHYKNVNVLVDGKCVHRIFIEKKVALKEIEKRIKGKL